MSDPIVVVVIAIGMTALILIGTVVIMAKCYRKVPLGRALIVSRAGAEPLVTFRAMVVLPFIHSVEELDVTARRIVLDRRGRESLTSKDGARVSLKATFVVSVNPATADVVAVATKLGTARANDPKQVEEHFSGKFLESLRIVAAARNSADFARGDQYKDEVLSYLGTDLSGFKVDDLVIESIDVARA